jgi:integrase
MHSLRHTFGTAAFATSGYDVAVQSLLLSPADVSTTRGCVRRAARAHPRAET